MTPEEFKPKFRTDVQVIAPNGQPTQRHPRYCLSDESAAELAVLMGSNLNLQVEVFQGPAAPVIQRWGSGWGDTSTVAWLQFTDGDPSAQPLGTRINAGLLADFFNHGYAPRYALACAIREYENCAYDQGYGPPPPTAPVH